MKISGLNQKFQGTLVIIAISVSAHTALARPKVLFEVAEIPGYPGAINNLGVVVSDRDINDLGDILVGESTLIRNGVPILLEAGGQFPAFYANALNNRGEAAGSVIDGYVSTGNTVFVRQHAAVWSNGVVRALAPIATDIATVATDINDAGFAVGAMYPTTSTPGAYTAVFFHEGRTIHLGALLGHSYSYARAVNNRGDALCVSWTVSEERRAFLVRAGTIVDFGVLPGDSYSDAGGLNNRGDVVGYSLDAQGRQRAFAFIDGAMHDLTDFVKPNSGWTFLTANAINDKGQIIGIGQINGGAHTTFLLTPRKEPKPPHFKPPHGVFPGTQ